MRGDFFSTSSPCNLVGIGMYFVIAKHTSHTSVCKDFWCKPPYLAVSQFPRVYVVHMEYEFDQA